MPVLPLERRRTARRFRPPRRLRILRPGFLLLGGTLALGLATLNTGNNLLYVLLGALLGMIVLSGWMSERNLRRLRVTRLGPWAVTAGHEARLGYRVHNDKPTFPTCALEVREANLDPGAFAPIIEAGTATVVSAPLVLPRRGVYTLYRVALATSFPFGLFRKERDLYLPGVLVVRPDATRPVRPPRLEGGAAAIAASSAASSAAGGSRGAFRGLRTWRPGDDPRDVHWRSTARMREPIVREYDREAGDEPWLVLDLRASAPEVGERAVATAASLAALLTARGRAFGFVAGDDRLARGSGSAHLEAVLDRLAAVDLAPDAGSPALPAPPARCILVSAAPATGPWLDVYGPGEFA